jgi:chromosome segregation ATPase
MSWFTRKQPAAKALIRTPDPNPVIEARLQQLDELTRQNGFKLTQIDLYHSEISALLHQTRHFAAEAASACYTQDEDRYKAQIKKGEERIEKLQAEIRQLEADIQANHERIIQARETFERTRYDMIRSDHFTYPATD